MYTKELHNKYNQKLSQVLGAQLNISKLLYESLSRIIKY